MSCLVIQVGQCGNQVGNHFFDMMYASLTGDPIHDMQNPFFTFLSAKAKKSARCIANAILVDMEAKAIERCLRNREDRRQNWEYDNDMVVFDQGGSANNWACGFHVNGPRFTTQIMDKIHGFAEKVERLSSILLIQSLAGGTGSGVGSLICQTVREQFPTLTLLSCAIVPFIDGEVSVQSYNSVLSLSNLSSYSNGVILFENEKLLKQQPVLSSGMSTKCTPLSGSKANAFDDLNELISSSLVANIAPVGRSSSSAALYDVSRLSANPNKPFLTARVLPWYPSHAQNVREFDETRWDALGARMERMFARGALTEHIPISTVRTTRGKYHSFDACGESVSRDTSETFRRFDAASRSHKNCATEAHFSFHGEGAVDAAKGLMADNKLLKYGEDKANLGFGKLIESLSSISAKSAGDDSNIDSNSSFYCDVSAKGSAVKCQSHTKSLGLLSNCLTPCLGLAAIESKASNLLSHRFYSHHFEQFGTSENDIEDAILFIKDSLNYYSRGMPKNF